MSLQKSTKVPVKDTKEANELTLTIQRLCLFYLQQREDVKREAVGSGEEVLGFLFFDTSVFDYLDQCRVPLPFLDLK